MTSSPATRRRRSLVQFLTDNNPFYLMSAASMLLACLLLSNTTTWSPIALSRLAGLIGTLGVYELMLVGLGLYLIARRGRNRDGIILLVLEAIFLADIGFLSSEAYQESLSAGLVVNGVLLTVGLAKLVAIFRVLRMPLASPAFALVVVTLIVLLGHPAMLKHLSDRDRGHVPEAAMYAIWWVVGLLVAAYGIALQSPSARVFRGTRDAIAGAGIGHVFMSTLLVLLVAHVGTAHWVFDCPFRAADLSPLFAGMAVLLSNVPRNRFVRSTDAVVGCLAFSIACVLTSVGATRHLNVHLGSVTLTPLALASMSAYLAMAYCFARRRFVRLLVMGVAVGIAYVVAPPWSTIYSSLERSFVWLSDRLARVVPRSRVGWGVLALVGAFALFAIGAAFSLRQQDPPKDEEEDSNEPSPSTGATGEIAGTDK